MLFHCKPANQQKDIDICINFMGRPKTKPFSKRKRAPKLYFHFWPQKVSSLLLFNTYQLVMWKYNCEPLCPKHAKHSISSICRKASQQLNILKRLGRYLDRLSKLTIFHTFIFSNFNFCPLAWHFCTDKNSKKSTSLCIRWLHQFIYQPSWKSSSALLTDQTY